MGQYKGSSVSVMASSQWQNPTHILNKPALLGQARNRNRGSAEGQTLVPVSRQSRVDK